MSLGLLLVYGGNQLARPILIHAGIICLGLAMIVMGLEAIVQRRLIRWKRGRPRETYRGIPAIFQGIQFNLIGLFLIGAAIMMQFNNGREIFQEVIRRPGLLLVLLGGLCLLQMLIVLGGSGKPRDESQGLRLFALVVSRLFPGLIWLVFGLVLLALGMFDILAPMRFDEVGGRILEELYGPR
jgi:hypothetical protein